MKNSIKTILLVSSAALALSACSQVEEVDTNLVSSEPVTGLTEMARVAPASLVSYDRGSTVSRPVIIPSRLGVSQPVAAPSGFQPPQQVVPPVRSLPPQPVFQTQPQVIRPVSVTQRSAAPINVAQQNSRQEGAFAVRSGVARAGGAAPASPFGPDGPPNPQPGECYARVVIPAEVESYPDRIVVEPEMTRTRIVPAKYGEVMETVVVKEATESLQVVPASYRSVTEDIVVRPAARQVIPVEPRYDTVEERVLVTPERQVWKKGRGPIERINSHTGEILCLVTEPAVYNTVKKRVLVQPGTTRTEIIPAVTREIERQVIVTPARVEKKIIPAVTREIRKRVIIEPAKQEIVRVPAKYKTVTKRRTISGPRTIWKSILCETNTTPDLIRRLQVALRDRGFNPGRIDGVLGPQTQSAVDRFQRSLGMDSRGITIDTLKSLGVRP